MKRTTEMGARGLGVLVLLSLAAAPLPVARSQMSLPFTGQGNEPAEPVDVYVSAMLERLLDVDDKNYRFTNIVYVYLSWTDDRAHDLMMDSTRAYRNGTKEECERPCSSDSVGSLSRESEGFHYHDTCCDGIWLPTIEMLNVYELPEGRLQPYGIIKDEESAAVAWWVAIHATYFTPMDFHRFPFDHQELDMQFSFTPEIDPAIKSFIPSATSTRYLVKGEGDVISGWDIANIRVVPKKDSLQEELDFFVGTYGELSAADDPAPITGVPGRQGYIGKAERVGFDIFIGINRLSEYYVLGIIVPTLLLVALSFITYIIPADSLDARIGLNVTLFLALTALQFVINDQLPKSSYPTAITEIVVVCYAVVSFAVPESIVVYAIAASIDQRIKQERETMDAMISKSSSHGLTKDKSSKEDGADFLDEAEVGTGETPRSMTRAMKFFKRKRSQKVPFIIDMTALCVMVLIVVISTTLLIMGI